MFKTGLTEQEKESLLKWFLINGELTLDKEGNQVFRMFTKELHCQFGIDTLIIKANDNIRNQIIEIVK